MPIGPTSPYRCVPTTQVCCISLVVLPTAWMTSVTVPLARSKSAMVSGMRSPFRMRHHDDELPRLGGARHQRMVNDQ